MIKTHLSKEKVNSIFNHNIRNNDYIKVLKDNYYNLLVSNYGPNCGITMIQNCAGNEIYTSSSSIILQQLQFHHPTFKFLNALIDAQNKAYGTYGLYTGILCSGLLYRFLLLENCSFRLIKQVSEWISEKILLILEENNELISRKLDISIVEHVLSMVRSIVGSKIFAIELHQEEYNHLCMKIIELFAKCIPKNKNDFLDIHISTSVGPTTLSTYIFEGILYREPDITEEDIEKKLSNLGENNVKIILFNVPISVTDELTKNEVKWGEKFENMEESYNDYIVNKLITLMKDNGIHILGNQKYISPIIKYELEKSGLIVLERLGSKLMNSLVSISQCVPINSLSTIENIESNIGHIDLIKPIDIEGKMYLHLNSKNCPGSLTFLVAGTNSNLVNYLKEVTETCVNLLQHLVINDAAVVIGGGCLETFICYRICNIINSDTNELYRKLDANPIKIAQIMNVYIETLLKIAIKPSGGNSKRIVDYYVDSTYNHLWEYSHVVLGESSAVDRDKSVVLGESSAVDRDKSVVLGESSAVDRDKNNLSHGQFFVNSKENSTCVCKCVKSDNLNKSTKFNSLLDMNNYCDFNIGKNTDVTEEINLDSLRQKFKSIDINDSGYFISNFNRNCIVDYWPAKLNALRMAFEGFSELFRIGKCIFDK